MHRNETPPECARRTRYWSVHAGRAVGAYCAFWWGNGGRTAVCRLRTFETVCLGSPAPYVAKGAAKQENGLFGCVFFELVSPRLAAGTGLGFYELPPGAWDCCLGR